MIRFLLLSAGFVSIACAPAHGFWQRSQIQACREAQTAVERERLECRAFEPVREWPAPSFGHYETRTRLHREAPVVRK